jgi:hypothetical protein
MGGRGRPAVTRASVLESMACHGSGDRDRGRHGVLEGASTPSGAAYSAVPSRPRTAREPKSQTLVLLFEEPDLIPSTRRLAPDPCSAQSSPVVAMTRRALTPGSVHRRHRGAPTQGRFRESCHRCHHGCRLAQRQQILTELGDDMSRSPTPSERASAGNAESTGSTNPARRGRQSYAEQFRSRPRRLQLRMSDPSSHTGRKAYATCCLRDEWR